MIRQTTIRLLALLFVFTIVSKAQNDIIINEIMYDPATGQPEWVEIYNRSSNTYDLANWKLSDALNARTITTKSISIGPDEFVVLTQDTSIVNFFTISATIIPLGSWSGLNNSGDEVVLIDNTSQTIDSLKYTDSWGTDDKSIERIDVNSSSTNQNNWAVCLSPDNGTPGSRNSVAPKADDIAVSSIVLNPSQPIENMPVSARVKVKNLGTNNAASFTLYLYEDKNFNSTPDAGELVNSVSLSNLASKDSVTQNFNLGSFPVGDIRLIAIAEYAGDQNTGNNELIEDFTINPNPPTYNAVIINEIMYDPSTGEPEWIEIYNRSGTSYLIKDWSISDATSTTTITTQLVYIRSKEYIIIAANNDIENFYDIKARLIITSLPSLNNGGDKIILSDFNMDVVDSLSYQDTWGGGDGKSLERIKTNDDSFEPNNWGTSISPFNATPGSINSITPKAHDIGIEMVTFSPIPVVDGDDVEIQVLSKNLGAQSASEYLINFYWDQNKDSVAAANERVEGQSQQLAAGDSGIVTFNFNEVSEGKYYFIFKVNYTDDEYEFNDIYYATLIVGGKPLPYNSLIINEIMYTPQDDEPEWIELYNRSDNTINIKGWQISDPSNTATITNDDIIIEPDSFLVIADNDKIRDYYNYPIRLITTNLPTLNNSGDTIVLSDSLSFVNDSLLFTSSWGGTNGKSLERINPDVETTLQSNWGTSVNSDRATPGGKNSVVPREYDVTMSYFNSQLDFFFKDEEVVLQSKIRNTGTNSAAGVGLKIYYDANSDSLFTEDEILEEFTNIELAPDEEIEKTVSHIFTSSGQVYLLAVAHFGNDNYPENDSLFLSREIVEPNVNRSEIVINEFLYAPTSPYPEWIEIYNTTDIPQQLRSFSIADSRDTVSISTQNILLPENSFLIIARDSIITQLYDIPSAVVIKEFPSLNNSGDKLMLLDNYNRVIDSLEYSSVWGGEDGKSLERINPFGSSVLSSNWSTSADSALGTPGKVNSIVPKEYDVVVNDFYSSPAQPVEGEKVSLTATVENKGTESAAFSLILYESNSSGDKLQSLETIQITEMTPTEQRTVNFDYTIESFSGNRFFVAEAQFEQDQDLDNNSKLLLVTSSTAPLSLVINEIMYNPDDEEPEWIELYNRSASSVNLKDWQVADVITNPDYETITAQDIFIEPGEYIVLSKDSGIYNFHPGLESSQVILVNFANLNNTNDGVVLYERLGNVVDSVFYGDSFAKKSGHSIERLSTEASSNDPANWNYSTSSEKGTPGKVNSRVPKDYDLAVNFILLDPQYPELNEQIQISANIINLGRLTSSSCTVKLSSAVLTLNETINISTLDTNTSTFVTASNYYNMPESFELTVEIIYPDDQNLSNNILTETFYSGYPAASVLINEVMYDPNETGTEWVEFVNATNYEINLNRWKAAEGSSFDTPGTFTEEDIIIQPGEYFIIADDTTNGKFANVTSPVFQFNFGELNSSADIVAIFDFRGALIDSLKYSSSWGGGDGYSLERVSLQSQTNLRTNWLPSIIHGGSTPGASNSTTGLTQPEKKQIVINEIMFEPESGNSEFIEFYNTSDQFVEIANWQIEDDSKNINILTRNTFTISPESYFVIAADSSILLNYPELKEFNQLIIANKNLSLNNTDDLVLLSDAFGEVIDSVYYNSFWHNKRIISTKDKSLERINPFLDGNDKNNWSTSVAKDGATPGKANSIYIENQSSNNTISVSPNPFSPDGDGFEDFTIISYNLPRDVTSIQIKVFDSKGRKVRTINESNLFGQQGSIIFDGYNDDGQPLKIGIYILFIEALNSSSGTVDTFKEVVVVARKL